MGESRLPESDMGESRSCIMNVEGYSEPCQTSKMERFVIIVNG